MTGKGRAGKKDTHQLSEENVGIYWLTCDGCNGWEIFENTGIAGQYDEKTDKKELRSDANTASSSTN